METGSRISIWRPFIFRNRNSNILDVDWAALLEFSMQIDFDVLHCDTSSKRKPEVDLQCCGRHLRNYYDVITRLPMVRFGYNLVYRPKITCRWRRKRQRGTGSRISIWRPFVIGFSCGLSYLGEICDANSLDVFKCGLFATLLPPSWTIDMTSQLRHISSNSDKICKPVPNHIQVTTVGQKPKPEI